MNGEWPGFTSRASDGYIRLGIIVIRFSFGLWSCGIGVELGVQGLNAPMVRSLVRDSAGR